MIHSLCWLTSRNLSAQFNGIKHSHSSPYHPATNGEAEWFVYTFKEVMNTRKRDGLTLSHRLLNFQLTYYGELNFQPQQHSTVGAIKLCIEVIQVINTFIQKEKLSHSSYHIK